MDDPQLRDFRRRRDRRRLRRILRRWVRADALARSRRLRFHYPLPRPRPLLSEPPPLVEAALAEVDVDVRAEIRALVQGQPGPEIDPERSFYSGGRIEDRAERGLSQFREALVNQALADPSRIASIHPQYLSFARSPQPTRIRRPIATLVFVKMPLRLMMVFLIIFNLAYVGAYYRFNDEVLGGFLTARLGKILGGELYFGSCHWNGAAIVDLVIGRPHQVYCEDVVVYDNYKHTTEPREETSIHVERIDAELYLHEIIPWGRFGIVPRSFPWVLHLRNAKTTGPVIADIRAQQPAGLDGEWVVNLVHSFKLADYKQKAGNKTIGFLIEDAHLSDVHFSLDFVERAGWGTQLHFDEVDFD